MGSLQVGFFLMILQQDYNPSGFLILYTVRCYWLKIFWSNLLLPFPLQAIAQFPLWETKYEFFA